MKTILCATDFSEPANNASRYAASLADFFKARLVLLNCYSLPMTGQDALPSMEILGKISDSSVSLLQKQKTLIALDYPDIKVVAESRMGDVVHVIEDLTKEFDAGLIVMGIKGQAGFIKENLIGSNAVDVAREINTPLFIIPEGATYNPIQKISFAWALSNEEDFNLAYKARYFCNAFSAKLEIVNIESGKEELTLSRDSKREFLESNLKNVKHETLILDDESPAQAIEEYFKMSPTDVIMIHPKKYSFFETIIHRSTTKELAFHSKTPLLIIH